MDGPPESSLPELKDEMIQPKDEADQNLDNDHNSSNVGFESTDPFYGLPFQHHNPIHDRHRMGNVSSGKSDDEMDCKPDLASFIDQGLACTKCGKSYSYMKPLEEHMKYCGKTDGKLQCFLCPFETKWKKSLKGHIGQKHPIDAIDYLVCSGCRKYYKGKTNLRVHMRYCGKTTLTKLKCLLCSYEAKWKGNLNRHLKRKHPEHRIDGPIHNSLKEYAGPDEMGQFMKCFLCPFETKYKGNLGAHMRQKHPSDAIDYLGCTACGKPHDLNNPRQHIKHCGKTHLVKFKCFFCYFETNYKRCLKDHIIRRHPLHELVRPVCTGCGKSYADGKILGIHMKRCGKTDKRKQLKFQCFLCSWVTHRKSSLRCHIVWRHLGRVEETDRSVCTGCGKSYESIAYLKRHMKFFCKKMTNGNVKFKCSLCSYKTESMAVLRNHIQARHSSADENKRSGKKKERLTMAI